MAGDARVVLHNALVLPCITQEGLPLICLCSEIFRQTSSLNPCRSQPAAILAFPFSVFDVNGKGCPNAPGSVGLCRSRVIIGRSSDLVYSLIEAKLEGVWLRHFRSRTTITRAIQVINFFLFIIKQQLTLFELTRT